MQYDLVCVVANRVGNTSRVTKIRITFKLEHYRICTLKILRKEKQAVPKMWFRLRPGKADGTNGNRVSIPVPEIE